VQEYLTSIPTMMSDSFGGGGLLKL
jgi:hypothetical protein